VPTLAPAVRGPLRAVGASVLSAGAWLGASGSTNLAQTNGLVWAMVAISVAGSIVTFAFLVYALWKFRDPKVKHRRYG
jgi:heme/copper-type cytochrome/quinol oxidase subunit 2